MSFKPILINLSNNHEIEINKDRFSVGRSLQADYVLDNLAVSRIHFFLEAKDEKWLITDRSTNGTLVNGELLTSTKILQSGDLIKFRGGLITLRFLEGPSRFITTSSTPVTDFIVSTISGDNLPSVSNDHCYERRGAEEGKYGSDVFVFTAGAVAPSDTTPNASDPPTATSSPTSKRDRSPEVAEIPKKNKSKDEASNNGNNLREELECSVCQELFIKAATLNCSHTFCNSCILKWKSQRNYCPICREPIKTISPSIVLDNIIAKVVEDMDQESKELRDQMVKERSKAISDIDQSTTTPFEDDLNDFYEGPDYDEDAAEDLVDDMLDLDVDDFEEDYQSDLPYEEEYDEAYEDDMYDVEYDMEDPDEGHDSVLEYPEEVADYEKHYELAEDLMNDMLDFGDEMDCSYDGDDYEENDVAEDDGGYEY